MKIKGAFPVRWAAQNGSDGKGVTIVKTEIKYASSTSGTTKPSSGWQKTIPSVSDGNYLWTWTHVEYSDGTKTDAYSVSRHGIDGKGIKSSVTKYCQKSNTNTAPHNFPESDWGDFPTSLTNDYWLYTRTIVTYSDNDTAVSYDVSQIGQGSYYAGCNEYYAVSKSKTEAPSGYPDTKDFVDGVATYVNGEVVTVGQAWSTNRPDADTDNPYIWNFEISYDSRGNKYVTRPICIGNFAKGIVSIVETYAISAQGSVPEGRDYPSDIKEKDWTDEHFAAPPTNEKPYQWNKTVTTYNDGTTDTIYHVSSVKGIDGKGAVYIDLDNENDSMLYDGSGNLISGNMVSNIKLYDNGSEKKSGITFTVDSSSGVTASISGSTLTVTAMSANSGYVIVKCIYNGVPYYARFTCNKIIGTDKYEIVCTPSAITFNDDTDTGSQVTVIIQVYKTAQNGGRNLLTSLPTGYSLIYKSKDTQTEGTTLDYSDSKAKFKPDDKSHNRYRIELLDASGNVLDYETIPISHVKNGEQGASSFVLDAENENIGFVVENNGRYSESQSRTIKINAYYGAAKVTSGVTYSVETEGNTDASGRNYLSVSGVKDGEITIGTQDNLVWTKDKVVNVKITATHATYGTRSIIISCVPVFGGADADYYELQPSLDAITFSKTTDGQSLTPSSRSLVIQCKHIKKGVPEIVDLPTGYTIRYSYSDYPTAPSGTNSGTGYTSGQVITVNSSTTNTMLYIVLFNGTNVVDKESIPIIKGGIDGNPTITMNLSNDMSTFASNARGLALDTTTHSTIVSLYLGTAQQAITGMSAVCSDADMIVECKKDNNGKYTGEVVVEIPGDALYSENSEVVINAKCAASTLSYEKVFTLHNVRSGADGLPSTLYELQPSLDVLSFARNETGGYSPATLQVYCGYIKIVGSSRTSYAGNNVNNLWKIDGKYEIMGRYHKADGSTTGWTRAKDLSNGTFTIQGSSDYTAIEFIFTSATGVSQVSDSNIFDREIVPVMRDGANGETTFYYAIPSAEKITRKHDGTLSPATINCKVYKKTGTDDPELVTSGAQGSYDYYVGTAKYTVVNYTGGNITPTPWWTKIVFYLKSSDGVVLTQREILVENEDVSPEQNLLNDTNFTNLLLDSSTNRYKSEVLECEGVDGSNALLCNPDSLEKDAVPYTEVWTQAVSQPNDKRLLPRTWYTLSFWAKTLGYSQIDIKQSSNLYGFATKSVYLVAATHTLRIRGNVSPLALSAGRELRVFVYNEDWSWQTYVSIKVSYTKESEVSFTPPSDGTYNITAYCYIAGGGDASAAQTVYLEWYRLKLANRTNILHSYCHPNVIDTTQVQVHDGNVIDSRPSDGYNTVTLTQSWKRFYMVFKTKSTIPTEVNKVLFRIPKNGNSIYLSQMKLERGVFPTAWTGSNNDTKGYSGAKPYFRKFSEIKGKEIKVYQGVGDEEWYTIVYDDEENTGWYTPKYTHTTTKDEVLTDAAKWLMSSMNFVATSVFFAQMAYIENLGVRNVLLSDGSTIEGGMCHSDKNDAGDSLGLGDVRFWLGNANPALGKIRGYYNGKFVAADGKAVFDPSGNVTLCGGNAKFDKNGNTTIKNLTATNGSFTGVVNATSGKFSGELQSSTGTVGGFNLSNYYLEAVKSTGQKLYLSPDRVHFSDNSSGTRDVFIGSNVMPSSIGGNSKGPMVIMVDDKSYSLPYCNSGIYIDVKGSEIDDTYDFNGNHALYVEHGDFMGLRPKVRRVSKSVVVSKNDFTILKVGSSDVTLTLSSSPEDSEMHFFRRTGTGKMTIAVGNTSHRILKKDGSQVTSHSVSDGSLICVIWDSVNSMWTCNFMG